MHFLRGWKFALNYDVTAFSEKELPQKARA
jgi:hypothetical protein